MEGTITTAELRIARSTLEQALGAGAQKARVTLDKSRMDMVNTLNGEVDKVTHCLDLCLTLNVFVDGKYGSFSTNRVVEGGMEPFVRKAIQTARTMAPDACRDLPERSRTVRDATRGRELGTCDEAAYSAMDAAGRMSIALRASIFTELNAARTLENDCSGQSGRPENGLPLLDELPGGRKCPKYRYISEEAEYSDTVEDSLIIDSEGLECRHTETSFDYAVEVTVEDARGTKFSAFWWDASPTLNGLRWEDCCHIALAKAVAQIHPKGIPGGKYNMVIDSEVASKVVSPLLRALSAYSIQQNNSFLADTAGRKVFPEGLTIMDRPRSQGEPGAKMFDSEGVATFNAPVIDRGVVCGYFVNTYMSRKMGIPPTREDALRSAVLPWPREGLSRDDLLEMCGEGILVTDFNGGNSNSSTGDFSFGVEGFLFRDGKIVCPVREMLVTGNFLTLWEGFIAAADDARVCMSKLIPTLAFSNVDFSA